MENSRIKCRLLDIEGTTTSIDFVKHTLFPYASENLPNYLTEHWNEPDIQSIVQLVRSESKSMVDAPLVVENGDDKAIQDSLVQNLLWQMDRDLKTTGLKDLQGKIWKHGYETGKIESHVYDDVPEAFKTWTEKICIYSSGSIQAQKLLFAHTAYGDLTPFISDYFDTTTGPKANPESYTKIANCLGFLPEEILFYTDIPKEAKASKEAGFQAVLVVRPGNAELEDSDKDKYPTIYNFTS